MGPSLPYIVAIGVVLPGMLRGTVAHDPAQGLPIVDLGYELHQASYFNHSGGFYNFSNIRYAAPPVGEDRFRLPKPPARDRAQVQTGSRDRICPQAWTAWLDIAEQFLPLYLGGQTTFNTSTFNTSSVPSAPPVDPRTTEDCLFLDVIVPRETFERTGERKPAPVLVWIYGGGFCTGSKSGSGNPAGLIQRSRLHGAESVIYVSMNYRLGAFGWLAGPTFEEDGIANAGLYDQRFALEWVQKYIHLFGGDPNRVTVFGESAGGGSIMHHITAFSGKAPLLFQQAIMQSPAFFPKVGSLEQEETFKHFLKLVNVTTLDEARQLSTTTLQWANQEQVGASPYGKYPYGPTVDGSIVTAPPGLLMLHGEYATDVNIMVGHNLDEGLFLTSPGIQDDAAFRKWVTALLPTARAYPALVDHVTDVLYPPIFDGSQAQGYTDQISRASAFVGDVVISCNAFYVNRAFGNNSYAYWFTVPPATHGLDVPYTYFNGPTPMVVDDSVAILLQEYITNFAESGTPNRAGLTHVPRYGDNATVLELNITTSRQRDPAANSRCDWWQKALYS